MKWGPQTARYVPVPGASPPALVCHSQWTLWPAERLAETPPLPHCLPSVEPGSAASPHPPQNGYCMVRSPLTKSSMMAHKNSFLYHGNAATERLLRGSGARSRSHLPPPPPPGPVLVSGRILLPPIKGHPLTHEKPPINKSRSGHTKGMTLDIGGITCFCVYGTVAGPPCATCSKWLNC